MTDTSHDLQAICDSCLAPIAEGEGHVWTDQHVSLKEARKARGESVEWMDNDPITDIADTLLVGEAGVAWHVTHAECAPRMPSWAYAIPVERITTWPAFLHWTAHLMGKGWLGATDWDRLIHRAVNPHHSTPSGLRPIRPQDTEFRGIGL
jgi:hypothetical protein